MNDELKQYLKGMEDRLSERFDAVDARLEEQLSITSQAFTNLEKHMDERFTVIETRLDRIENVLLARHESQIERLVDDVRLLKTKVGLV